MKLVRRLQAEPPLLAAYRQANPGEEVRPAEEAGKVWDNFKADVAAYRQVLEELAKTQQGLCLYCEHRLVDGAGNLINDHQVEHVVPKSMGGGVLDWTNLALACRGGTNPYHREASQRHQGRVNVSCGQAKGNRSLRPRTDPRDAPLVDPLIHSRLDGRLTVNEPACTAAGVSASDLSWSVDECLKLNCERLRVARQNTGDNLRRKLVELLRDLGPSLQQQAYESLCERHLRPDGGGFLNRFWTAERSALGPPAEAWIAANQGLFT